MARFSSNVSIYIGIVVSVALAMQLASHIMSSGVGAEITFMEFVTVPSNLFYILLRVCLCMAFWIMNGVNNRTYVILWVVGDLLSALIYWNGLQIFLYEHKNIYVLNFLAVISLTPLYCLCRYRVLLLFSLFWCLQKVGFLTRWAATQQTRLTITKVTTNLDRWLSFVIVIEIVFALLFSMVSLYFNLAPGESIEQHFIASNWPDLFAYHLTILEIWNLLFCLVLIRVAIDDRQQPDAFTPVSADIKKRVIDKRNKK